MCDTAVAVAASAAGSTESGTALLLGHIVDDRRCGVAATGNFLEIPGQQWQLRVSGWQ